ncbi:MAG: hypothetical protein IPO35_16660 [Uliginosibacterium sp.]|nr:hypothetical protein [Uliginosibacterium sp.]
MGATPARSPPHHIAIAPKPCRCAEARSAEKMLARLAARFLLLPPTGHRQGLPPLAGEPPAHGRAKVLFRHFGSLMATELKPENDDN